MISALISFNAKKMSKEILEAVPIGMALGMLTHLCGLSNPQAIRGQFIFDKHVMLKTFLGGVTGSALSFAILSLINPDEFDKKRAAKGYGDKGAITAAMGGFLQGAGMAISGEFCTLKTFCNNEFFSTTAKEIENENLL